MHTHTTAYGEDAVARLRQDVGEAKGGNALAPVTVIVRDNIAALSVRRALASGIGRHAGVAAVNVTTLRRVAEHLLSLAGRTLPPVTSALLTTIWRAELDKSPGSFASVAAHPATVRALNRAHRELRNADPAALAEIGASGVLTGDLVRLHRCVTERVMNGRRDEAQTLRDATLLVAGEPTAASTLGVVVCHLPDELDPSELGLVRALDAVQPLRVLLGTTNRPEVDGPLREQFGHAAHQADGSEVSATASRVIHASDADDEVRAIVREVVALLAAGTPAHRIAILYPKGVPYARLLSDHLAEAGIASNGPGIRPLRDRAVADAFLALLALDPEDLRRVSVFDWLGRAPVRSGAGSGTVPRTRWERLSREAGVTGGDWGVRLDEFRGGVLARLDAKRSDPEVSAGSLAYLERQIREVDELRTFIDELATTLRGGRTVTGWAALAEWALAAFRRYFGSSDSMTRLPEPEQRAATAIEVTLRGLPELDGLGEAPSLHEAMQILDIDLDERRPRVGRFGEGVFVGSISSAASLHVTNLFVLGLSEDLYPGRQSADPLLSDDVRVATSGALRSSRDLVRGQQRALLAAFACARHVTASFPRGDLRRGSERLPSRWLMPTLRLLSDEPDLAATRWFDASSPHLRSVESHWRGVASAEQPSTEQEWRLRRRAGGGELHDPTIRAARILISERESDAFTRFDGNLEHVDGLPDYADGARLISPTALERYAGCPHTFFVERLLNVSALESPEDIISIRPMDVGNIVHEVMDRLAVEFSGALPGYGEPWNSGQRDRMREIAAETMAAYERRGLTGHPRLWLRESEVILINLEALMDADDEMRAARDARVVASELQFGMNGIPPVLVQVDGGAVALRGSADRVDERRDGTYIVTDFKSGSATSFSGIEQDAVAAGSKLQLPLYAHAARAAYGVAEVEAEYWFVGSKSRGKRVRVELNDEVEARYKFALGTLVRGIREGRFIPRPPPGDDFAWVQCAYCNPDGVGYGHVRAASERKRSDGALAGLFALLDPSAHAVAGADR